MDGPTGLAVHVTPRAPVHPTMAALSRDVKQGECIFCGDPLPPKRQSGGLEKLICGTVECFMSYDRVRKADVRAAKRRQDIEADMADALSLIREGFAIIIRVRRRMQQGRLPGEG